MYKLIQKEGVLLVLLSIAAASPVWAQTKVYRCGNAYGTSATQISGKSCKLVDGGNVTVISVDKKTITTTAPTASSASNAQPSSASTTKSENMYGTGAVRSTEQKNRDADARAILEVELRKAQERKIDLSKDYNNGDPEKLGSEAKNYQKYLDRVAELKAAMARNDSDIAGLQRELMRLAPVATSK